MLISIFIVFGFVSCDSEPYVVGQVESARELKRALEEGTESILIKSGEYSLDDNLTIKSSTKLYASGSKIDISFASGKGFIIDKSVGNGNVVFENLNIKGNLVVNGGGNNSIHLVNTAIKDVEMAKEVKEGDEIPRLVLEKGSKIDNLLVSKKAYIEAEEKSISNAKINAETIIIENSADKIFEKTDSQSASKAQTGVVKVGNDYYATFIDAINNSKAGDTVTLLANAEFENLYIRESLNIDLNGKTLTITEQMSLEDSSVPYSVVISNGKLNATNVVLLEPRYSAIEVNENASLRLYKVDMTSEMSGIFAVNNMNNIKIELDSSTLKVKGYYGICTNATKVESDNVVFILKDSVVETDGNKNNGDNTPLLFNVKGHVEIINSTIKGDRQAVILRGGEGHKIINSTLITTANNSISDFYLETDWKDGNEVPLAALVIGNRSGANLYPYPTSVTLDNAKIVVEDGRNKSNYETAVYVYQSNDTNKASVEGTLSEDSDKTVNSNTNDAKVDIKNALT